MNAFRIERPLARAALPGRAPRAEFAALSCGPIIRQRAPPDLHPPVLT